MNSNIVVHDLYLFGIIDPAQVLLQVAYIKNILLFGLKFNLR